MSMQLGKSGVSSDMNVTPLIDVLLVLLIIFMVAMPMKMIQHRVDVPEKADVDLPPEVTKEQVVLTYTKDEEIFLNTNRVDPPTQAALQQRLISIFQNRTEKDKAIFLNIDPKANYGKAVEIIDTVRNSGLNTLAIVTKNDNFQIPSAAGSTDIEVPLGTQP